MSKRIMIITVYDTINCGSFLQAWALKKAFSDLDCDVVFQRSPLSRRLQLLFRRLHRLSQAGIEGDYKQCKNRKKMFHSFRKLQNNLQLTSKNDGRTVVIGSDTLWNFRLSFFQRYQDRFLGTQIDEKYLCAYAVSAGNSDVKDFLEIENINEKLTRFTVLSVRDGKTQDIVKEISGRMPQIVCDPTLLLASDRYNELSIMNIQQKYIFLYYYGSISHELEQCIKKMAKENEWLIYSAEFSEKRTWCDKTIPCTPDQFISYMKNAKMIITNTFHGTVFSVIFQKKFIVYRAEQTKVTDFLKDIELENRSCNSPGEAFIVYNQPIKYESVDKKLEKIRSESLEIIQEITAV